MVQIPFSWIHANHSEGFAVPIYKHSEFSGGTSKAQEA